jgi:hypothetical protein
VPAGDNSSPPDRPPWRAARPASSGGGATRGLGGGTGLTAAATRPSDRPDPVPEAIRDDPAGSYGRALAALIIAIADITSEPNPTKGR